MLVMQEALLKGSQYSGLDKTRRIFIRYIKKFCDYMFRSNMVTYFLQPFQYWIYFKNLPLLR